MVRRLCKARKNQKYVEEKAGQGYCEQCPQCGSGKERNFKSNIKLQRGPYGDTQCYPCESCTSGRFNDGRTENCQSCTFNKCLNLNRPIKTQCNATADEQCETSCIPGYKDEENDTAFPCVKDPDVSFRKSHVITSTQIPQQTIVDSDGHDINNFIASFGPELVAGLVGVIVVVLVVVWLCYKKQQQKKLAQAVSSVSSSVPLTFKEKVSTEVETDGPPDRGPYPELAAFSKHYRPQIHPELPSGSSEQSRDYKYHAISQLEIPSEFKDILMKTKINILTKVSRLIPENAVRMFEALDLKNHDYYPQEELFERCLQSHQEYVYQVLLTWTKVKGDGATLGRLCKALHSVGFDSALQEVLTCIQTRPECRSELYPCISADND